MRKLFTGVCFLHSLFLFAQNDDSVMIRRIANDGLLNGKAYDNLHYLTKQIGGRLTGSPEMVKAEKWGLKVLSETGSEKTWLQECMVPHWVRGGKDQATADYKTAKKTLDITALGNSQGTGPKGLRAEVIEVKTFDELEKKKDQVKGKIVFYNYKFNPTFIKTFEAYGDAVQYRGSGPSHAAKYVALAVVVRSMSESTDNNPHTGSLRYDTTLPEIPAAAIGLRDADWLDSVLQKSKASILLQ